MVIRVPSTCAVPVACAVHPDDIMLLTGKAIVNAMSSPVIVPENAPGIPPCIPEKLIEPVTLDPLCVSGHVMVPRPAWPIMLPEPMEILESDAVPAHVPAIDVVDVVVIVGELAPQATAKDVTRTTARIRFIV